MEFDRKAAEQIGRYDATYLDGRMHRPKKTTMAQIAMVWDECLSEARGFANEDDHPLRDYYWTAFWTRWDELAEVSGPNGD